MSRLHRSSDGSPKRGILIVGGKLKIVRKAKSLGLDILYFQKKAHYTAEHAPFADHVCLFDYEDERIALPLARSLVSLTPFQSALSLTEPGLLPVARINDALGMGGTSYRTAHLLMEKGEMRRLLNAHGFSRVEAVEGRTRADLEVFIQAHGLPVTLKPVDGARRSACVSRDSEPSPDRRGWLTLRNVGRGRFIVEEYPWRGPS